MGCRAQIRQEVGTRVEGCHPSRLKQQQGKEPALRDYAFGRGVGVYGWFSAACSQDVRSIFPSKLCLIFRLFFACLFLLQPSLAFCEREAVRLQPNGLEARGL